MVIRVAVMARNVAAPANYREQCMRPTCSSPNIHQSARSIDRLRAFRVPPSSPTTVGHLAVPLVQGMRQTNARMRSAGAALQNIIGESTWMRLRIVRVRGDVLTLSASNATDRFSLERALTPRGLVHESLSRVGIARLRWTRF